MEKELNENLELSTESIDNFIDFLESQEDYLDCGLGAFHTDDHSNWEKIIK